MEISKQSRLGQKAVNPQFNITINDTPGQRPVINFVEFLLYVSNTRMYREAGLSTDDHLVVRWIRWWRRLPKRPD